MDNVVYKKILFKNNTKPKKNFFLSFTEAVKCTLKTWLIFFYFLTLVKELPVSNDNMNHDLCYPSPFVKLVWEICQIDQKLAINIFGN